MDQPQEDQDHLSTLYESCGHYDQDQEETPPEDAKVFTEQGYCPPCWDHIVDFGEPHRRGENHARRFNYGIRI